MQRTSTQDKRYRGHRQALNALRIRGLQAQSVLLGMGITRYTAHIEAWAAMNGVRLPDNAAKRIQQILNGNATASDAKLVDVIERAVTFYQSR